MRNRIIAAACATGIAGGLLLSSCSATLSPVQSKTVRTCGDIQNFPIGNDGTPYSVNPNAGQAEDAEYEAYGTPLANDLAAWLNASYSGDIAAIQRTANVVAADCGAVGVALQFPKGQ